MAKDSNKKQVEQITDMEVDFAQWYTDVCRKAELIDYSSHQGYVHLPPLWLRHLGEHPARAGPEVQGDRTRACTFPCSSSPCSRREEGPM